MGAPNEVGARPFSMLRSYLLTCGALWLKRCCSRFCHLLILLDGAGAHADGTHDITVAAQGDAAGEDYEVPSMRVAKAEEGPSGLRLVHQVLCLALEGYRSIGLIDRDGNAPDQSAILTWALRFPPASTTAMSMGQSISCAFCSAASM